MTPELSVGDPGRLRLWGVTGSPSVDTLAEGDAPSSPELTVGADGDAVEWKRSAERYLQPSRGNIITAFRNALSLR